MKPFQIVIGIVGSAVMIIAGIGVRSKMAYDNDSRDISKLIAEYRAVGIPTNGDEIFHRIPDCENAWVEIGPMLVIPGAPTPFKSEEAVELMMTCGKKDLPLIKRYLAENESKRNAIEAALKAKPKLQVPHDYDEGYMMMLQEMTPIRSVVREYCLAAYAAGLEGNMPEVKRNLNLANRFVVLCTDRSEYISAMIGASLRKTMMQSAYRIIEAKPSLQPELRALMTSPEMTTYTDPKRVAESEFVAQLELARYFDIAQMDKPDVPSFLKGFIKGPEENEIFKLGKARAGDYIPQSFTMRKFLKARLEHWKPFMTEMVKSGFPSMDKYSFATDFGDSLPSKLQAFVGPGNNQDSQIYRGLGTGRMNNEMNLVIFKSLDAKQKTGSYPSSLESLGFGLDSTISADNISLIADKNGVLVRCNSGKTLEDNALPSLSFPARLSVEPKTLSHYAAKVNDFRVGKISVAGSDVKKGAKSRLVVPPGAPKPVP